MAIADEAKEYLDIPHARHQLGTLIKDAESAAPGAIALADTHILVGNGAGVAADVAVSGDATMANTGALTVSNAAVIGKVLTGFVSGAGAVAAADTILQAFNKIDGNVAAKLATASFTDAAVTSKLLTGFVAGAGAVAATDTILQAFNKDVANLAAKVPDKIIALSGSFTTAGGDVNESIANASILATDLAFVQVETGTGYVVSANAQAGSIDVVMSADPGAATVLNWFVLRV